MAVFDDLGADPQAFIDGVTDWLGADRLELDEQMRGARLPVAEARSPRVARMARRAAEWARERDGHELVGRIKRSRATQAVLYRARPGLRDTMSPEDADYVRAELHDEIVSLETRFGLDLRRRWGWSH